MNVVNGETSLCKITRRKANSPYDKEEANIGVFFCREANTMERKSYRVQQGVNATSKSTFLISSNMPTDIKDGDYVDYLGKQWIVESVGYYINDTNIMNRGIMDNDYLINISPKGITLK